LIGFHGFAAARNFSFQQATKEYILWLDADDVIQEADRKKFIQLKNNLSSSIDSVSMEYQLSFDDQGKAVRSFSFIVYRRCFAINAEVRSLSQVELGEIRFNFHSKGVLDFGRHQAEEGKHLFSIDTI
jgi:glycosyltransferase involved in cell wall biosynthesis